MVRPAIRSFGRRKLGVELRVRLLQTVEHFRAIHAHLLAAHAKQLPIGQGAEAGLEGRAETQFQETLLDAIHVVGRGFGAAACPEGPDEQEKDADQDSAT